MMVVCMPLAISHEVLETIGDEIKNHLWWLHGVTKRWQPEANLSICVK
jgi:hypothetical protein